MGGAPDPNACLVLWEEEEEEVEGQYSRLPYSLREVQRSCLR